MTRQTHIDRRALFASGAAAALLAATGVSAQPAPQRGGRLRLALSGAARTDSFDLRGAAGQGLFMQVATAGLVFDALTEVAADGTLRGELATAWRSNADGSRWDFDLREDAVFHNGSPFSAQDAVASFEAQRQGLLFDVTALEATGPHSLRLSLAAGDPDLPFRLSAPDLVILPLGPDSVFAEGVGTGLYRLHKSDPGRHLVAHRVEAHYKDGRAGWFDTVELVSLTADAVRAEALRDHLVDAADLSHPAGLDGMEGLRLLPEEHFMTAAVDHCIALPAQIGRRWPLDNLRAAERWWMA